ncbi:MAG: hypothetical protein ACI9EB_001721 [Pseudomonas sp.]|jgi:hypothetical protein
MDELFKSLEFYMGENMEERVWRPPKKLHVRRPKSALAGIYCSLTASAKMLQID